MVQTQEDLIREYVDRLSADRDEPCQQCGAMCVELYSAGGGYICGDCLDDDAERWPDDGDRFPREEKCAD